MLAALVALLGGGPAAAQSGVLLEPFVALPNDAPIGYFVAPAGADARPGDQELCRWALDDWARNSDGRISVVPASEGEALVRIYFAALDRRGQYGEMRPILVNGRRGAEVYVRADTEALVPEIAAAARADPLLRETIVYLTCLHEIGHALGLTHTDRFADIMYYFGFGGDIFDYFSIYRRQIESRQDIQRQSGLSAGDIARMRALWPAAAEE